MAFVTILLALLVWASSGCNAAAMQSMNTVNIVGEMKNVRWKGQLYGNITLDTIGNKTNLYGLGPVEY